MWRGSFRRLAVFLVAVAFAVAGVVRPANARGGHGGAHGGRGGGGSHVGGMGRGGFRGGGAHGGHVHHFRVGHHGFVLGLGTGLFYPFPYYSPYYYDPYYYYYDPYCHYDPYYPSPYDYGASDPYQPPYEPSAPAVPDSSQGVPPFQAPLQAGSTSTPQPLFCWDAGSLRWQPCSPEPAAQPPPSTASPSSGAPGVN